MYTCIFCNTRFSINAWNWHVLRQEWKKNKNLRIQESIILFVTRLQIFMRICIFENMYNFNVTFLWMQGGVIVENYFMYIGYFMFYTLYYYYTTVTVWIFMQIHIFEKVIKRYNTYQRLYKTYLFHIYIYILYILFVLYFLQMSYKCVKICSFSKSIVREIDWFENETNENGEAVF